MHSGIVTGPSVVHFSPRIAEDAQLQDLGQQLVALGLRVALLSTDQYQQTGGDGTIGWFLST